MPSSNRQTSSNAAHAQMSNRTQTNAISRAATRPLNVPNRQFIIILTNNPDMIRRTRSFRPQTATQRIQNTVATSVTSTDHRTNNTSDTFQNHREQILNNLLQVELSEAMSYYLARTHRSFPIHYVFDMSNLESSTLRQI